MRHPPLIGVVKPVAIRHESRKKFITCGFGLMAAGIVVGRSGVGGRPAYHPPATAPQIINGSMPANTASGSNVPGGSWDRSFSHAKYRSKGRRFLVT